jgi:hypothetical protein
MGSESLPPPQALRLPANASAQAQRRREGFSVNFFMSPRREGNTLMGMMEKFLSV